MSRIVAPNFGIFRMGRFSRVRDRSGVLLLDPPIVDWPVGLPRLGLHLFDPVNLRRENDYMKTIKNDEISTYMVILLSSHYPQS